MKTTVELNDDLLEKARHLASTKGWTVRTVLEESLRSYLDLIAVAATETRPFQLRHTIVKGKGLKNPAMTFEEMVELANRTPSK